MRCFGVLLFGHIILTKALKMLIFIDQRIGNCLVLVGFGVEHLVQNLHIIFLVFFSKRIIVLLSVIVVADYLGFGGTNVGASDVSGECIALLELQEAVIN